MLLMVNKNVEIVARAFEKARYSQCGGADASSVIKGTPNWKFCIPDAAIAVQALRAAGSLGCVPMVVRRGDCSDVFG